MVELVACNECCRHVLATEKQCPFCAAPLLPAPSRSTTTSARQRGRIAGALLGASVIGAGSLVNGCEASSAAPPYGAPPYWSGGNTSADQGGAPSANGGGTNQEQGGEAGARK